LKCLKARQHSNSINKEEHALARKAFEEAIALDPNYALAYQGLAHSHYKDMVFKWTSTPKKSFEKAMELAKKAIALDESLAGGYMSFLYPRMKQYEKSVALAEQYVVLNPNSAVAYWYLGRALNKAAGKHEEAIAAHKKAIRLDPVPQLKYLSHLAISCRDAGRYDEAIENCEKILQQQPDYLLAHTCLASCYALMGRDEEAHAAAAEVLKINPNFSAEYLVKRAMYKYEVDRKRLLDSFLKAGLPR